MQRLERFVGKIRQERKLTNEVPGFDPTNGNENAQYLFLLEAPGGKAVTSGFVSLDNEDQTARNFKAQLKKANINRSDIVIWNVVPWYLGNRSRIRAANSKDVEQGLKYLDDLLGKLKKLKCIVLVGGAARKAHIHLSYTTSVRILSCYHPSPKVINNVPAAMNENIKVFKALKRLS